MSRDQKILEQMGDELVDIAQREKVTIQEVLDTLKRIDPTPQKKYMLWLCHELSRERFRLEDEPRIRTLITNYDKIKRRLPEMQRNVRDFNLHQLDQLVDNVLHPDLYQTNELTSGAFPVIKDSQILYNGPLGQLAVPLTVNASIELGRGTKWCTAARELDDNMFDVYNNDFDDPLYVWRDASGKKYQFHIGSGQFMNDKDERIDKIKLYYFVHKHPILSKFFQDTRRKVLSGEIQDSEEPGKMIYSFFKNFIGQRDPEAEQKFLDITADGLLYAIRYAMHFNIEKWPELGHKILASHNSDLCVEFAKWLLKDRWPDAERIISEDDYASLEYAKNVIKDRFIEGEPRILLETYTALAYAESVIKGRWPELEIDLLTCNRSKIIDYCERIIIKHQNNGDSRWSEGEQQLIKEFEKGNLLDKITPYAKNIIKGRWLEAETVLLKRSKNKLNDPKTTSDEAKKHLDCIVNYSKNVIQTRWPDAERLILDGVKHNFYSISDLYEPAIDYNQKVIKGRWLELEHHILNDLKNNQNQQGMNFRQIMSTVIDYSNKVIKGRWFDAEETLLTLNQSNNMVIMRYAQEVIKGRWRGLEDKIIASKDIYSIYEYLKEVANERWIEAEPVLKKAAQSHPFCNEVWLSYCHRYFQTPDKNNKKKIDTSNNFGQVRF